MKDLRRELKQLADEQTKQGAQRYFKEAITLYGIKAADIHRIAKACFKQIKGGSKAELFAICEALWQSGMYEEGVIACRFSYFIHRHYQAEDLAVFEAWIEKYVSNWALCDTLCNHNVGTLVEMYPEKVKVLHNWADSPNRWMRRAAAVSLIVPAKRGLFLEDVFQIASILLTDTDDLVQKGYGWLLKVAAQHHAKEVFDFVTENKKEMPRTALRYAVENMPEALRLTAMKK